jgi:hypothetical protein
MIGRFIHPDDPLVGHFFNDIEAGPWVDYANLCIEPSSKNDGYLKYILDATRPAKGSEWKISAAEIISFNKAISKLNSIQELRTCYLITYRSKFGGVLYGVVIGKWGRLSEDKSWMPLEFYISGINGFNVIKSVY